MKKKEFYILFITSLLLATIACNNNSKDVSVFSINESINFSGNSLQFSNEQNDPISFNFNINNNFPLSSKNHLDSIFQLIQLYQLDTPTAAFEYVVNSTFHNTFPVSQSQWAHSPYIFFNSLASGYCDDVSTFLVNLFIDLGYPARVVNLEGHVASEVYHKGKWKLFDPDQRVFFFNENNEVSSLKEIETDSFSIKHPSSSFINYYKKYYLSSENNSNIEGGVLNNQENDTIFTLPSHSSFSIYFYNIQNLNLACVQLSTLSKGALNIPLVPYCIKGGTLKYHLNGESLSTNNNSKKIIEDYAQIEIIEVSENVTIYYLINPYLKIFESNNSLKLLASDKLEFTNKKIHTPNCDAQLNYWKIEKRFDGLFKDKLASYYKDTIITSFDPSKLEAEFEIYSSFYENTFNFHDVLNYKSEIIKNLSIEEKNFDQILVDYYPLSTFFLFTSLIENEKEFFIDKFKTVKHEQ